MRMGAKVRNVVISPRVHCLTGSFPQHGARLCVADNDNLDQMFCSNLLHKFSRHNLRYMRNFVIVCTANEVIAVRFQSGNRGTLVIADAEHLYSWDSAYGGTKNMTSHV